MKLSRRSLVGAGVAAMAWAVPAANPALGDAQTASGVREGRAKSAVVYFSATGNTAEVAEQLASVLGADLYQIVPEEPYTEADLDYNDPSSRANLEVNDDASRPAIADDLSAVGDYDAVYLGHPIWWGSVPPVVETFLDACDLSRSALYTFCTSGSTGIEGSVEDLRRLHPELDLIEGRRFSRPSEDDLASWVEGHRDSRGRAYIHVGDEALAIELADNSSAAAFVDLLAQGDVAVEMSDYGDFEKVGELGAELPRNDERITTAPGDVILYQGDKIVVYYDENSWNFTRLGRVADMSRQDVLDFLGIGTVEVTFSLKSAL